MVFCAVYFGTYVEGRRLLGPSARSAEGNGSVGGYCSGSTSNAGGCALGNFVAAASAPVAGGFAGALAWTVSYPLDCVKVMSTWCPCNEA